MKKITLLLILSLGSFNIYSQSSVVDAKSITAAKYVNQVAIDAAIPSPEEGMQVYNLALKSYVVYDGISWKPLSVGTASWGLSGNAGTNAATNFIGTTDNQALHFKVNNIHAGEINPTTLNTSFGLAALTNNTSGRRNTAVGTYALNSNTFGFSNTAVGTYALYSNTTGHSNTAFGGGALYSNTTGNFNAASGTSALASNTSGRSNTALGHTALSSNTTGEDNTAVGGGALGSNTFGFSNTALGRNALYYNTTGFDNTASGTLALFSNTTGVNNTASGNNALRSNTTGFNNTASGAYALWINTTGYFNTAVGTYALRSNTTGYSNTASGDNALYSNTAGNFNTAFGRNALHNNTTGFNNTATGNNALFNNTIGWLNTASGNNALFDNTTGSNNTSVGYEAGASNSTGNNNIFIGAFSNSSTSDISNSTAIGFGTIVNASNKVQIGNSFITVIEGQVPFTNPSDRRLKENINAKNNLGLEFINHLQPVSYNYIADATKVRHDGFIAQDVEKAMKDLGIEFSGLKKDTEGMYSLAYSDFVMPLVNAVKELKSESEYQQKLIDELTKKNEVLEVLIKRVTALEELKAQNIIPASGK